MKISKGVGMALKHQPTNQPGFHRTIIVAKGINDKYL